MIAVEYKIMPTQSATLTYLSDKIGDSNEHFIALLRYLNEKIHYWIESK
jgi:hypothetical protein